MFPKFYINEGRRCAQTVIKSILKEDISYEKLEFLSGRKENQITTPLQIAYTLKKLNKDFLYPVKPFFLNGTLEKLKKLTLEEFNKSIFRKTNFEFIDYAWKELKKSEDLLINNFNFKKLRKFLYEGKIPLCLINYDIYVGRRDEKRGHYLIINQLEEDFSMIMDSGPEGANPNKKINTKRLENCLMETPLDYGVVLVALNKSL